MESRWTRDGLRNPHNNPRSQGENTLAQTDKQSNPRVKLLDPSFQKQRNFESVTGFLTRATLSFIFGMLMSEGK